MGKRDILRYIVVFVITLGIFVVAGVLSNFFNGQKITEVKKIQDKIGIDILSSETQFQLLQELSCNQVSQNSLSKELNDLAEKITYSEANINLKSEVTELKRYYSLLQIKDYLLVQKIKEKCKLPVEPIFYFYTTAENCTECEKQAIALTKLRQTYPEVRVYAFDYNLDLSALHSLISIFKIEDTKLPALVVKEKLYTGYKSVEEIEKYIPEIVLEKKKRDEEILKQQNEKEQGIQTENISNTTTN